MDCIPFRWQWEENIRSLTKPPIKDIHDFSGLDLDCIKLENDDAAYKAFDAIRYIQDAVGDEITCGMNFTAPFTVATGVVGVEPFLTACAREPEIAFQVLDFVVQAQCKLAKSFLEAGITVGTSDPVASCTVINPKMYRKYAKPYEMKFAEFCSSYTGRPMSIHICGNTTKILKDVADAGFVTFSLDNMVDLEVAKEKIGDQVHLVGKSGQMSANVIEKHGIPRKDLQSIPDVICHMELRKRI